MALLEASGIKKIYTTENNVNVGISDINLMFDKNEIVAITGASGSGKSTLLHVLGGLETYEDGELYFEGLPTSHYTSDEWAEYLNNNISFIFQDYNILESLTVLENVLYSLTYIKSGKKRKEKAIEIIEKVGLKDRIDTKCAQLSGGEKQRTVIARALAKDSPIILADEPTGNLDSNTTEKIVDLLKEVAEDKLLIIVTHNYEDIKRIATRHIRMLNGQVDLDEGGSVEHVSVQNKNLFDFTEEREIIFKKKKRHKDKGGYLKDGIGLGIKRYNSRPKQNILMTLLLMVASILIMITSVALIPSNVSEGDLLKQPGRILLVTKDDSMFTPIIAENLVKDLKAKDAIVYDSALDSVYYEGQTYPNMMEIEKKMKFKLGFDLNYALDEGRQIASPGEIVLKVPYTAKGKYKLGNKIDLVGKYVGFNNNDNYSSANSQKGVGTFTCKIVGLTYYFGSDVIYGDIHKYDAQKIAIKLRNPAKVSVICSHDGIQFAYNANLRINGELDHQSAILYLNSYDANRTTVDKVVFGEETNVATALKLDPIDVEVEQVKPFLEGMSNSFSEYAVIDISQEAYDNLIYERVYKESSSKQISLYFNNEVEAKNAVRDLAKLYSGKYLTFMAKDYVGETPKIGMSMFIALAVAVVIAMVMIFSLVKMFETSKEDIYIYRTMGIAKNVIKESIYTQVFLDTLPSIPTLILTYILCFFTPLGIHLNFMPITGVVILSVVMLLMGVCVGAAFNRVIFKDRVNKGLRRINK